SQQAARRRPRQLFVRAARLCPPLARQRLGRVRSCESQRDGDERRPNGRRARTGRRPLLSAAAVALQPAPVYIVAAPRPRAGKTLLARLLMEYVPNNRRPLVGFDLNPREPVLANRFPALVWPVDIGDIRGQMELFDRLVADTASTKVIDLGSQSFEQFFSVMGDIGFTQEARRSGMDAVVLFLTDQATTTAR